MIYHPGGAAVPDTELALQQRRGAAAVLDADFGGLTEERVSVLRQVAGPPPFHRGFLPAFPGRHDGEDVLLRGRLDGRTALLLAQHPLLSVPAGDPLRLARVYIRSLEAHRLALTRWQEQHVTVSEERFRSVLIQNRAAVHLRRHAEGDAAREVGLDQTGNDVHAGALCRQDDVDARRPCLLGQNGEGFFDFGLDGHHEVGQLFDDHHDERQGRSLVRHYRG